MCNFEEYTSRGTSPMTGVTFLKIPATEETAVGVYGEQGVMFNNGYECQFVHKVRRRFIQKYCGTNKNMRS
jgi:hypothetical protein